MDTEQDTSPLSKDELRGLKLYGPHNMDTEPNTSPEQLSGTATLEHDGGSKREYTISEMKLQRWEAAMTVMERERGWTEPELLDLAWNQKRGWSLTLTPESFTLASQKSYDANPHFFSAVGRAMGWRKARADIGQTPSRS